MSFLISLICVVALGQGQALQKSPDKLPPFAGPKKRVAVPGFLSKVEAMTVTSVLPSGGTGSATVPLEATGPLGIGDGMADMLNTALIDSKRFIVLERKDIKEVLDELGVSGADPNMAAGAAVNNGGAAAPPPPVSRLDPATAPKQGKLLGAQFLIRGALTELSYSKSSKSAGGGILSAVAGQECASFTAICAIDLKVIEVETGRILDSIRAEGRAESKAKSLDLGIGGVRFGEQKFEASPLAKAIRSAIDDGVKKICSRLDKMPWEARIAAISDKGGARTLYLNFGNDAGIKVGDALEIFHPGENVVDPQTGIVIGRQEDVIVGKCVVRSLTKTMAIASVDGQAVGAAAGDGIRLPKPAGEPSPSCNIEGISHSRKKNPWKTCLADVPLRYACLGTSS